MQGSFSVWLSHKRGATRMKELARFKPMQRHLFLYERALLFCKRREEHGDGCDKTASYSFKHCLKVVLCLHICTSAILWPIAPIFAVNFLKKNVLNPKITQTFLVDHLLHCCTAQAKWWGVIRLTCEKPTVSDNCQARLIYIIILVILH